MIVALLLAAAAPQTAIDAERAFAADAAAHGQWTAFRRWSAEDAIMFAPEPVKVRNFLKDRSDPPASVAWSPTASYVSCDGGMAVNTGEWRGPNGGSGYFTTVWVRQADGSWRWTLDSGDDLTMPRARVAEPALRKASCTGKPTPPPTTQYYAGPSATVASPDGTLAYHWHQLGAARTLTVYVWNGRTMDAALTDSVTAPK